MKTLTLSELIEGRDNGEGREIHECPVGETLYELIIKGDDLRAIKYKDERISKKGNKYYLYYLGELGTEFISFEKLILEDAVVTIFVSTKEAYHSNYPGEKELKLEVCRNMSIKDYNQYLKNVARVDEGLKQLEEWKRKGLL